MYPILEYDGDSKPIISPSLFFKALKGAEYCVICFFKEVVDKIARKDGTRLVTTLKTEAGEHPVYELEQGSKKVAFFHPLAGAPLAAGLMDEVIAHGYSKFVACGGAGVLDKNIQTGKLIIPRAAVRDEGTSYHYVTPSREIELDPYVVGRLEEILTVKKIPYVIAKTWTTDAFYRETEKRRNKRRKEGCLTVEMECAAFAAVASHRNVLFGQYLYGGDDISGEKWDNRNWEKHSIRESLFWLAMDACVTL
jgi:uridine phosphorylase